MKFFQKAKYHQLKVGIPFFYEANSSRIKGQKEAKNKHFSSFQIITVKLVCKCMDLSKIVPQCSI